MAATDPNFDADDFIAGIHTAMSLGFAPDQSDQPVFHFAPVVTTSDSVDDDGIPFDPDSRPTSVSPPTKRVPCAIDYIDAMGKVDTFGTIVASRVLLTFLDVDYQQVVGFDWVVIGPNRYFYRKTRPPMGLDSVGLHQVECVAEDEK
jgi:hypothetical protein